MDAYKIKICKRENGCRNAVYNESDIVDDIVSIFDELNFTDFVMNEIQVPMKSHHQFKITIACCPNSCPRPHIVDLGIIAATPVTVTKEPCLNCKSCINTCIEDAIQLDEMNGPEINQKRCVYCAKCADNCPTGTIKVKDQGYRVFLGGKLGRHPRLASEFPGVFPKQEALVIVKNSIKLFTENYSRTKRFADLFSIYDETEIIGKIALASY